MNVLYGYLLIGAVLGLTAAVLLTSRYRAKVLTPARELHGPGQVAVGQDLLTLAVIVLLVVVAWLPILAAYGYMRGRRASARRRSSENNPTLTV